MGAEAGCRFDNLSHCLFGLVAVHVYEGSVWLRWELKRYRGREVGWVELTLNDGLWVWGGMSYKMSW